MFAILPANSTTVSDKLSAFREFPVVGCQCKTTDHSQITSRPFELQTGNWKLTPKSPFTMARAVILPKIRRRRSKLHGFGVFAVEPINKNKRIIDYAGQLITNKQSEAREDRYLRKGCIWVFRVNRNWSRDANVDGNVARFINHSCKPNCWVDVVDKTIWIRAARRIEPGDELTYDYNTEGDKVIPCRCRPGCRTRL
jgi:hypothetical protein